MNLPPYDVFPTPANDEIVLRQVRATDMEEVLDISFYDGKKAATVEQALYMLERINEDYAKGDSIHWGIEDKVTGRLVGTCGYYRGFENATGELGCVLLPAFYGKGYMTKAMNLAIGFGRNVMGLQRIGAITTRQNTKAIQLMERLGFELVADGEGDEVEYELRYR